ncbi:MAG: type II secretion system F family protein [archaeon]|nr:type II secretion system F family protein [archaeon]
MGLDDLKKKVEEKKKEKKLAPEKQEESVDFDQVEKIVERMKKKYRHEGVELEEVGGKLGELRGIIAGGEQSKVNVQKVEDLQEFKSPTVQKLGKFYLLFRLPLEPMSNILKGMPVASDIRYYLYSANMKYSLAQWLAVSTATAAIVGILSFLIVTLGLAYSGLPLTISAAYIVLISGILAVMALAVMLMVPKNRAVARGNDVSIELPFALRHMATELKAGIGLYKTIQTIATSDYGVLSEEFSRTITEIEEGTDTKDALKHFALRTQSKALRSALFHITRAMKTGGNLSEIMNTIAEDVSFEMRLKIRDFSEKMNFFGVIYIFAAIVLPVFVAIIGSVTNAPISISPFEIKPEAIAAFFVVLMPLLFIFLIGYLKLAQPRV